MDSTIGGVVLSATVAFIVYFNTLSAEFAYDDSRAIVKNQDLLPSTPWLSLVFNDFWGTPLTHSGSHKSYRPLCVATFRLNYVIGGHSPFGYHLVNVILHAIVSALFTYVVQTTLDDDRRRQMTSHNSPIKIILPGRDRVGAIAGLLFATHPIHTEAVAGVVGRADVLASLFFLLSLESYARYCRARGASRTVIEEHHEKIGDQRVCRASTMTSSGGGHNGVVNGTYQNGSVKATLNGSGCHHRVEKNGGTASSWWLFSTRWIPAACCVLFTTASMLSKEHGVTVLGVCLVYDVFIVNRLRFVDLCHIYKSRYRQLHEGIGVVSCAASLLIFGRVMFMGCRSPEFSPSDNPASDSSSLETRAMTFLFLPAFNWWLTLCPSRLSFDWSMGSVPLVETACDVRNLATISFYAGLITFLCRILMSLELSRSTSLRRSNSKADRSPSSSSSSSSTSSSGCRKSSPTLLNGNGSSHHNGNVVKNSSSPLCSPLTCDASYGGGSPAHGRYPLPRTNGGRARLDYRTSGTVNDVIVTSPRVALLSLALVVIPFVPATNLFFYVGFVVAERVLYIPSLGLCLLVAVGINRLMMSGSRARRTAVSVAFVGLLATFAVKTIVRNEDWKTEESLYRAGITVNPAKAWGNLANVLNAQGKSPEAESAYKAALNYRSNMADVHYNLGILYQDQGRYTEAIQSYKLAIQCRPRLTLAYLNLGIVYATVGLKAEAENIYRTCADIDTSGLKDPRLHEQTKVSALYNLGRLLDDQGRHQEAVDVYLSAVDKLPSHYAPQSLYNMLGEAYSKLSDFTSAEHWYRQALIAKPDHIPAHLTLAKLYHRQGLLDKAEDLFLRAQQIESKDANVYQHYGQYLTDVGRYNEAINSYMQAVQLAPGDFELVFNTASALRQAGRNNEAEHYYKRAVHLRPEMALAHMNLGAMLHFNGRLLEAESCYLTALRLQPNDEVTIANLNKLRNKLRAGNIDRV